jgi:hypothetical protein
MKSEDQLRKSDSLVVDHPMHREYEQLTYSQPSYSSKSRTIGRLWSMLPLAPITAVAFFIVAVNLIFVIFRLSLPYPISPWEAGIVVDAWRMLQGDSIYAVGTGHATHMYGPLITLLLAQAFRFTGPVLEVGRIVSAISGFAVVLLLARIFVRGDRIAFGVGAGLLLAANSRTFFYFTETRPDLVSIFFAMVGLIALYHSQKATTKQLQIPLLLTGSLLLVIAVFFKQTAVVFVFVPALATLGQPRVSTFRNQILCAAVPIVAVSVAFGAVWHLAPGLWHFMIDVPSQYHVSVFRAGRMAVELLASLPLFLLALLHWLFTDAPDTYLFPRCRWLLAALICTVPTSLLAFAKDGGTANSLIPALLSVGAFCAWRTPVALALLRDASRPVPLRIALGILLGIILFAHAFPDPRVLSLGSLKGGHGVQDRGLVVAEARSLPGKVVCPDDPTIALMAKGYAGRTAAFEADAVYWDPDRIQGVIQEVDSADFVIVMRHGRMPDGNVLVSTKLGWGTNEKVLQASGLTKREFRTTSTQVYELWHRARPPRQASPLSFKAF